MSKIHGYNFWLLGPYEGKNTSHCKVWSTWKEMEDDRQLSLVVVPGLRLNNLPNLIDFTRAAVKQLYHYYFRVPGKGALLAQLSPIL